MPVDELNKKTPTLASMGSPDGSANLESTWRQKFLEKSYISPPRKKKPTVSFGQENRRKMQEGRGDNIRRRMVQITAHALTHTCIACKNNQDEEEKGGKQERSKGIKECSIHCKHLLH